MPYLLPNDGQMVSGNPGPGNCSCLDKNKKTLKQDVKSRAGSNTIYSPSAPAPETFSIVLHWHGADKVNTPEQGPL